MTFEPSSDSDVANPPLGREGTRRLAIHEVHASAVAGDRPLFRSVDGNAAPTVGLRLTRADRQGAVYRALREAIIHGRVRPGEHLQPQQLARLLGVSQTPVREALIRLHMEGMVLATPRFGFYSKPFNQRELRSLYVLAHSMLSYAIHHPNGIFTSTGLEFPLRTGANHREDGPSGVAPIARTIETLLERIARLADNGEMLRVIRNFSARTRLIRMIDLEEERACTSIVTALSGVVHDLEADDRSAAAQRLDAQLQRKLDLIPKLADLANGRLLDAPLP